MAKHRPRKRRRARCFAASGRSRAASGLATLPLLREVEQPADWPLCATLCSRKTVTVTNHDTLQPPKALPRCDARARSFDPDSTARTSREGALGAPPRCRRVRRGRAARRAGRSRRMLESQSGGPRRAARSADESSRRERVRRLRPASRAPRSSSPRRSVSPRATRSPAVEERTASRAANLRRRSFACRRSAGPSPPGARRASRGRPSRERP